MKDIFIGWLTVWGLAFKMQSDHDGIQKKSAHKAERVLLLNERFEVERSTNQIILSAINSTVKVPRSSSLHIVHSKGGKVLVEKGGKVAITVNDATVIEEIDLPFETKCRSCSAPLPDSGVCDHCKTHH